MAAPTIAQLLDSFDGAYSASDLLAVLLKGQWADGTANSLLVGSSAATGTTSTVASSATNVTLLALNAARKGWSVFNDSTAVLYVKFGATATTSDYTVQIAAGGYYESPALVYTGKVDGIWASANGNARLTELT